MVKSTVRWSGGNQQDTRGNRTLRTVGGAVADDLLAVALALGHEGGGSAAVQVQSLDDALRNQEVRLLGLRHTDRVRILAAVSQEEHDGSVCLSADAVDGVQIRMGCRHVLSVTYQEEGACDGLLHVVQRGARVTEYACSVLQNGEVRLVGGLLLVPGNAVHNQRAGRLAGLHVEVVTVGGEDDILAGGCLVGGCLLAGGGQRPAVHGPLGGIGSLVVVAVGGLQLDILIGGEINGQHKAHDLLISACRVHDDIRLGYALGNRVIRGRNHILGLAGARINISVGSGRGKRRCGYKSEYEGECDQNAQKLCKTRFHVFFLSVFYGNSLSYAVAVVRNFAPFRLFQRTPRSGRTQVRLSL